MTKTALITGCTTGIGKETALTLAKQGFNLILISRSEEKLKELKAYILKTYHNKNIHYYVCDFENLISVVETAKVIAKRYDKLDVLINNAGLWNSRKATKNEGFGVTWTVNYLAPFLLTYHLRQLLLSTAKKTKDVRIINIASEAHRYGMINPKTDFVKKRVGTYGSTKLANMLYTFKMARILNGFGITVNAVHPGVVATGLWRELPGFVKWLMDKVLISAEKGAETMITLATMATLSETGKYWANRKNSKPSPTALNEKLQDEFYEKTKTILAKYL